MHGRSLEAEGAAAAAQHGAGTGEDTAGVLLDGHDVSERSQRTAFVTWMEASRNEEMSAQRSALPGMFL